MQNDNGAVYVQTNDAAGNEVVAFRRDGDGQLAPLGRFATGGRGSGAPHLPSQGSVVLTQDGAHLLVVNQDSEDVSVLAIRGQGLELIARVASGGSSPRSLAEHRGLVYVLNTGGEGNVSGFRLAGESLAPIPGSARPLSSPGADPAQVAFSPDGSMLVVTERGTDSVVAYDVDAGGLLGALRVQASSGPTPYGFAFAGNGTLVVTEAFRAEKGKAAASSYRLGSEGVTAITRSLGNGRSEICWAVSTRDGRFVYTTNFADGAVSRYAVRADGSLVLDDAVAGTAVADTPGLRDEDVSSDGRYLYALDANAQRIFGWAVGADGGLSPIGSWDGLPPTVAGLVAA